MFLGKMKMRFGWVCVGKWVAEGERGLNGEMEIEFFKD